MTHEEARHWLISKSLLLTTVLFVFLVVAPFAGFPLDAKSNDPVHLLEILIPVFVGYLGSAAHFVFGSGGVQTSRGKKLSANAVLLIKGPVLAWSIMSAAALITFGLSNRMGVPVGSGMTFQLLSGTLTVALSLLTATTNIAVAFLFKSEVAKVEPKKDA